MSGSRTNAAQFNDLPKDTFIEIFGYHSYSIQQIKTYRQVCKKWLESANDTPLANIYTVKTTHGKIEKHPATYNKILKVMRAADQLANKAAKISSLKKGKEELLNNTGPDFWSIVKTSFYATPVCTIAGAIAGLAGGLATGSWLVCLGSTGGGAMLPPAVGCGIATGAKVTHEIKQICCNTFFSYRIDREETQYEAEKQLQSNLPTILTMSK